ncbi:MAG: ATP-binding cassette domain-containing protein [Deltaproteobacteria bacterium]|nr:ATP-binding cassette domain-containing protein [Deltaproteobacteria bacterium]
MSKSHIIEVEHLVKKYANLAAVNDVTFSVEPGEIFGLLGPNGAGKTTTINILCTLSKPTSGKALINGFDIVRQQGQVRQCIGLVFQDPSLDERLTALENLDFHSRVYNIPASLRAERTEQVLKMVEPWERRRDVVKTFSGGMKRRLELARGLLHHPRVLFLDEPTLGLDPQTRNRLWEFILGLQKTEGTTIFLTTHYMDEAEYADRIAVMDYGQLIALDSPEVLKGMVGGDMISLSTTDDQKAQTELKERYNIQPEYDDGQISFEIADGSRFIPTLIKGLKTEILSISLRRPTLDDVFLKLTGHRLRDEAVRSEFKEIVRQMGRHQRRR